MRDCDTCVVLILFCLAITVVEETHGLCGSCELNSVACINETSFHPCILDSPDRTQIFTCPHGKICTQGSLRCAVRGTAKPACGVPPKCGECDGSKVFTCTGRSTFAQCGSNVTGRCPEGTFCQSSGGQICVHERDLRSHRQECDSEDEALNTLL